MMNYMSLHEAAGNNDIEAIKTFLLDKDLDVNRMMYGYTPLHCAITGHVNSTQIVTLLLENGADIDAKTNLHHETAIIQACRDGPAEVILLLLSKGANIHIRNVYEGTALHCAACNGYIQVIQLLLTNGADIHAKDNHGQTPVHEACFDANLEMIFVLMDHGADLRSIDNQGKMPTDLIEDDIDYSYMVKIIQQYEQLRQLKDWRPWNHFKYPIKYRQSLQTLVLLAKMI